MFLDCFLIVKSRIFKGQTLDFVFRIRFIKAAKTNIRRIRVDCFCKRIRSDIIVPVKTNDVFPDGNHAPRFSCRDQAAVRFMDNSHSSVFQRILVAYPRTIIRRTVVYKNKFKIPATLIQHAFHALP